MLLCAELYRGQPFNLLQEALACRVCQRGHIHGQTIDMLCRRCNKGYHAACCGREAPPALGEEWYCGPCEAARLELANQRCIVCEDADEEGFMLCDECNAGCHYLCAGLDAIPDDAWFCPDCEARFQAEAQAEAAPPPNPAANPRNNNPRPAVARGANRGRALGTLDGFQEDQVEVVNIGRRTRLCEHCNARLYEGEQTRSTICCRQGRCTPVADRFPQPPPQDLQELLAGLTPDSRFFLANIRFFNSALQMASSGIHLAQPRDGVSMLACQGNIYHCIGPLAPAPGEPAKFVQLYIIDEANNAQLQARLAAMRDALHRAARQRAAQPNPNQAQPAPDAPAVAGADAQPANAAHAAPAPVVGADDAALRDDDAALIYPQAPAPVEANDEVDAQMPPANNDVDAAPGPADAAAAAAAAADPEDAMRLGILSRLQALLLGDNEFVVQFLNAMQLPADEMAVADIQITTAGRVEVVENIHRGRVNPPAPGNREVAGLLPGVGDDAPEDAPQQGRRIITVPARAPVRQPGDNINRNNGLHFISDLHPAYGPLHFVLFHPRGELGWEPNMPHAPANVRPARRPAAPPPAPAAQPAPAANGVAVAGDVEVPAVRGRGRPRRHPRGRPRGGARARGAVGDAPPEVPPALDIPAPPDGLPAIQLPPPLDPDLPPVLDEPRAAVGDAPPEVPPDGLPAVQLPPLLNPDPPPDNLGAAEEWLCDSWVVTESQRLRYLRWNQQLLRASVYQGVTDAIAQGDVEGARQGRLIVLPSSHVGSPRQMVQLYQDAMAIVRNLGKPDLFITMTCNPEWPEIQDELLAGQSANDRPDLVARVFRLKLDRLLKDITKDHIFGRVKGYTYVVEWQKRGLPHAHLLVILHPEDKPRTPEDIDRFVCARLPDQREQPMLFNIVTKCMLHGPCGPGRSSPCMEQGRCSKGYPRLFCDRTDNTTGSYPIYARPNDGRTFNKRDQHGNMQAFTFNNTWVVPYNPYLLKRYNCHINVEICSSITAVKYLYKYVYKGHDVMQAAIAVARENGEVAAGRQEEKW